MFIRFLSLSIIGGLFGLTLFCVASLNQNINPQSPYYQIKPGMGLNAVIDHLSQSGQVSTPALVLKAYAYISQTKGGIHAGEYQLKADYTSRQLIELFRSGKVVQRKIVFPEGLTFAEWRERIKANPHITQTLQNVSDKKIMTRLGSKLEYAEGQFFPDTYLFNRGATDFSVLQTAFTRMERVIEDEWQARTPSTYLLNKQDALILASIVEKETGYGPDRDLIASVFANRLIKGMKLQSDPTVIYGMPEFDGNLKRSHLRQRSIYNTYVIDGLPFTPICNPGLASIRASLQAPPSEYYYFVARGDGRSQFSANLSDHNKAVVEYQIKNRVKQYQSSPNP